MFTFSSARTLAFALAAVASVAFGGVAAQADLSSTNNVTSLAGTWSSNSHVETGGSLLDA
ncbi:hypothetical protein QFC21_006693 [Naganishia friedmannii]|uniref:Uncharacterized protein n=1 Tax=Naganishia friedmannii TaxID=89922 RepID=A0ACC2V1C5_9TREE|nr:hypothetical protein QFC21_006693 [Naganishia friedmannii]